MLKICPFSELSTDRHREVAALLFAHLPGSERFERINQWLAAIEARALDPEKVLTVWHAGCVMGVQVVEVLPGKSAALWAIRARPGDERIAVEDQLLRGALSLLNASGVRFAQCLLSADERFAVDAIRRNGFERLTAVRHLVSAGTEETGRDGHGVVFRPYADAMAGEFERVLMQSFEGTLDCPELNELRSAEEVLEGHCASAPERSRWWLIEDAGDMAGVLILAESALPDYWDLAYLGVLPSSRGRGLGRAAVAFARQQSASAGQRGLTLMVDERNLPALRLYQAAGFECAGTRDVYLWKSARPAASSIFT